MVKQEDVEYMLNQGVGDYLSLRKNQFLDSFKIENFPKVLHNFYKKALQVFLTVGKTITTFIVLSKIYENVGLEKLGILLLSGYIAMQIGKDKVKEKT